MNAQRYLYSLQGRGMKFGMRNIRFLLARVDHPEKKFRSVHVAGTNGKGSTSSFLASMFMECGLKTGLYTSPHLIRFSERIRIDGKEIEEDRLLDYVTALRPFIEETRATFFEATTCIAFQYFADEGVNIAVVETGLGGRLDATNVLNPLVSVITSLSLDHTEILGRTISSISREKGGIIKRGVPCVTSTRDPVALRILKRIAARKSTIVRNPDSILRIESADAGRSSRIVLVGRRWRTGVLDIGLPGDHQIQNAHLAACAFELVARKERMLARVRCRDAVRRGLARVVRNTGLRGRCERIAHGSRFMLLDVAHNPGGAAVLAETLEKQFGKYIVLLGVLRDKDAQGIVLQLGRIATQFVCVTPRSTRALPARELAGVLTGVGLPAMTARNVHQGIARAVSLASPGTGILVTGSHYVVGDALEELQKI